MVKTCVQSSSAYPDLGKERGASPHFNNNDAFPIFPSFYTIFAPVSAKNRRKKFVKIDIFAPKCQNR